MSKEREESSINMISASTRPGGANVFRLSRGAGQQNINIQQYQGGVLQTSNQPQYTEGMHVAGGSSSRSGGAAQPALQQYSQGRAQQQGSMHMSSASAAGMQMGMSASNINTSTPCAACKLLRRRCAQECPFAPYFSPHEPQRFASVHKIYGASNVSKMLLEVPETQRAHAANSLVYEANARLRDPVYGCMGIISTLQQQAQALQAELNAVKGEVMRYRACHVEVAFQQHQQQQNPPSSIASPHDHHQNTTHPLSIEVEHYQKISVPSNLPNSTSIDVGDTKTCLLPWT